MHFLFMFIRDFVYVYLWTFYEGGRKRNEMVMVRAEMRSMSEYTEKNIVLIKKKNHILGECYCANYTQAVKLSNVYSSL